MNCIRVPLCSSRRFMAPTLTSWHDKLRSCRQISRKYIQASPEPIEAAESKGDGFEGLPKEEDEEVPGYYFDALNGNTRLGKAVRSACDELEILNHQELDLMEQAETLLKKLGIKQPFGPSITEVAALTQEAKGAEEADGGSEQAS